MTIEEVWSNVAQRMIEGLMTHSQLSDYFGFIGLKGFQECHLYHYFEENCNYKKVGDYYLKHYNKLLLDQPFKNPDVIPQDQFQYNRQQVTAEVRKEAIRAAIEKQVYQEKNTKKKYEQCYEALIQLNEIAGAAYLEQYIIDVDNELAEAEQLYLELMATDYDIHDIITTQDDVYKKYKKKLKEIKLC